MAMTEENDHNAFVVARENGLLPSTDAKYGVQSISGSIKTFAFVLRADKSNLLIKFDADELEK